VPQQYAETLEVLALAFAEVVERMPDRGRVSYTPPRGETLWFYADALLGIDHKITLRVPAFNPEFVFCFDGDELICQAFPERSFGVFDPSGAQEVGRDLDAVVQRGYEMQTQLAGITANAFVRASYDIKSGISSLSDQGVADMTAGAGAVNLGMQMSEQLTLLGMMQQQMQAGEAGTALRAFATNAARAHEAFAGMQVTAERPVRVRILDENGQLRAMPDILTDLKARYGETLDAFEAAEIKEAFGTDEAMKMINALYGQEEAVRANAEALVEAADQGAAFTAQMARAADSNWDAAMVLMSQKMDVLRQKIGERLLPVVERLLPVIDAFIVKEFDWIDANPALVTGIGAVVAGLGALAVVVAPLLIGAGALVGSWAMMSYGATRLALVVFNMGK